MRLRTPALCERAEDIQLLADDILAGSAGRRVLSFTRKARQAMQSYGWPGNVRELRNRVQRAVVMCSGLHPIEADDMELTNMDSLLLDGSLGGARSGGASGLCNGRWPASPISLEVARTLDISRATLYRQLDKHDLL